MTENIIQVWTFRSDSNPDLHYETLQYSDNSTSCNCKGWTRRVAADGTRSCKHTRYVDMGMADQNCIATYNYQSSTRKENNHAKNQSIKLKSLPKLGYRKFAV